MGYTIQVSSLGHSGHLPSSHFMITSMQCCGFSQVGIKGKHIESLGQDSGNVMQSLPEGHTGSSGFLGTQMSKQSSLQS